MLVLAEPDVRFERLYRDMMAEWSLADETPLPWPLQEDASDFAALTDRLNDIARGVGVAEGFTPSSTYYVYDEDTNVLVGAVNIRHWLGEKAGYWGHIGYGVRPSLRRRGYASAMLALALERCAAMGMTRAMAVCFKHNIASAKTILKNGGVLDKELPEPNTGQTIQQYWFDIPKGERP